MVKRITGLVALLIGLQASAQSLPPSPVDPACDGDIVTVRLVEVKPPATLEKYLQTMDIHRAWYRSHGFKNNEIFAARVFIRDAKSGVASYSTTQLMLYHIRPPYGPGTTNVTDAQWIAFHKTYDEISTIREQHQICMPKNHGG